MFKKRKTAFCLILALLFILSLAGMSFAQQSSDIQDHWAGKQISDWISKGLAQGYPDGAFKPDNSITRAEFVCLVNRSFGLTSTVKTDFSDVAPNNWFAGDIASARAAGYITVFEDGTFRPDKQISRQEAAVMLARLLKLETATDNSAYLDTFTDAKDISACSKGSVGAAVARGLINGYPDQTIRPAANISRAEAIVAIDRSIAVQVKVSKYDQPGTYGPASGTEIIEGNVLISAAGVTLQNTKITGSLVLAEGIGAGDVTLKNVIVQGETAVKGGGANSVVFENCTMPAVIVAKEGVRIVAAGNTSVNIVRLESGAALAELKITGPGFETVTLTQVIPENAKVILDGNFDNVKLEADKINLSVTGGVIEKLEVAGTAAGDKIDLGSSVKINTLILDAAVNVTGKGAIQTAKVNVSGSIIEPVPAVFDKAAGVTVTVGAASSTGGGSGSGQGPGGGGGVAPLNFLGAYLTSTGESIEGSLTVPKNPEIKLVFDRGVVRDHWDTNQQCITMRVQSGPSVPINVFRAPNYLDESEKKIIYVSPVNNLNPGTTYVITISAGLAANNDKTLGTQKEITFTVASGGGGGGGGDNTPPVFGQGYPTTANITQTSLDLLIRTNENGKAYYVILGNGAPAPTALQVKEGLDANNQAAVKSGSGNLTANTQLIINITGLTAGTAYDIYVAAEDSKPNLQAGPAKISVTTSVTTTENDLSNAGAALAADGSKTAGAAFDISITGAKDNTGADLAGAVAVTITSDKDGEVYNSDTAFTAGAATVSIAADKVITGGINTLTVTIAGVIPHPTVEVTVTAATQISPANSTAEIAPALAKGVTSALTITLKDNYGNPIANTAKNIKIVVTVTNADPATAEVYTVDGSAVTATTTLSRSITTDAAGKSTFTVIMPGAIDPADGISVQVTQNNGTAIGVPFTCTES